MLIFDVTKLPVCIRLPVFKWSLRYQKSVLQQVLLAIFGIEMQSVTTKSVFIYLQT